MPMNLADYNDGWRDLSRRVREEAGNVCEWCGVANGAGKVVLTVAHIDHNRRNDERSNLASLCQRCHLNHDREQHTATAKETYRRKRAARIAATGQLSLTEGER